MWLVGQGIEVEVSSRQATQHQAWELEWRDGRGAEKEDLKGSIEWVQTMVRMDGGQGLPGRIHSQFGPDMLASQPEGKAGGPGKALQAVPTEQQVWIALRHDQVDLPKHMSIHIRMGGAAITDVSPSPYT